MKPIFLIGLPGSGKSTFGKSIAAALDLKHIDLDKVIESRVNKSIDGISGATLSVRAVSRVSRYALYLHSLI